MNHLYFSKVAAGSLAAILLVLSACTGGNSQVERLQQQLDSLQAVNQNQQTNINGLQSFVTAMAEGLDTIARQEGALFYTNQGPEHTLADPGQLKLNLERFANTLSEQRGRILLMTDSLRRQGTSVEKLQKLVDYMNAQLDEKDRMIAKLRQELEAKDVDIARLSGQNTQLTQQVQTEKAKVNKLSAGYVVMGSSKVLKEYGVTIGGGLKKKKVNYEDLPRDLFTKVDTRTFGGLEIPAARAKLLSTHAPSSYEIVRTGAEASELHILDPETFWSSSRYVVIETK